MLILRQKVVRVECRVAQAHCAKVQRYIRAKQVSNFLICGTKNVVEDNGKRVEILHGRLFEG